MKSKSMGKDHFQEATFCDESTATKNPHSVLRGGLNCHLVRIPTIESRRSEVIG